MGTKAIIIDIRSTPDDPGYRDRGTVLGDDEMILWHEDMSGCPNAHNPPYAWCAVPGQYRWTCEMHRKHGKCLRLTDPANKLHPERIPTVNPNPTQAGARFADGVLVHRGFSATNRGSRACHTIWTGWAQVMALIEVGESGLYIIKRDAA